MKEKSRGVKCDSKNVNGQFIDGEIINVIKSILVPKSEVYKELKKMSIKKDDYSTQNEIDKLNNKYEKNKKEIASLIDKLKYVDSSLISVINDELVKLKKENDSLENQINKLKNEKLQNKQLNNNISQNAENVLEIIDNCFDIFDSFDLKTKRDILSLFIESAVYNSETDKIEINLLNDKIEDNRKDFLLSVAEKLIENDLSSEEKSRFTYI